MTRRLPQGIDLLPSGLYRARVPVEKLPNGRWRYLSKSFTRQRDAVAWRDSVKIAKQTGRVETLDSDLITLSELAAEHMQATHANLAAATYRTNRQVWKTHVHSHALAGMTLRAITPKVIEDFRDEILAAGAGPQSVRRLMVNMQTMFDRAVRDERIKANPVKLISKPKITRREGIVPVTPVEVEKIRAKLDGVDAVMVSVLAYTGMRPGEARGLKWSDLTPDGFNIWRAVGPEGVKATKTGHTRTHVPVCKALHADLEAWHRESGSPSKAEFIFPRQDGEPWSETDYRNWRKRKFRTAVEAAGVDLARPYDLRHAAASLWLAEGWQVVEVASWLGHNASETLKTYAHVVPGRKPGKRKTLDQRVSAARRDIAVTYALVMEGHDDVRSDGEKPSVEGAIGQIA
ncbi:MAG: site-specific integrase [Conexibacter sp.]|nr:site-specific integrase [Conexibacter sp.]